MGLKCWICGNQANSAEHKAKKSDLRAVFGSPACDNPLYFHDVTKSNQLIQGLNSKVLKFPKNICAYCNNTRTQPHDRAWQQMSLRLRDGNPKLRSRTSIRANKIFPYNTRQRMSDVHRYFLKLFGCMIVEAAIPLDISGFADSILNGRSHPYVYLELGCGMSKDGRSMVGGTDLHGLQNDVGECVFAAWQYQLDTLAVNVIYASPIGDWDKNRLARTWNPKFGTKILFLADPV